jgi:hypothetical protein
VPSDSRGPEVHDLLEMQRSVAGIGLQKHVGPIG